MSTTILLFKTDFHHSYSSRDLIGVFTNKAKYISAVSKIICEDLRRNPQDNEGEDLKDYINWNISFMLEKGQTQGLSSFELDSETVETNKIF